MHKGEGSSSPGSAMAAEIREQPAIAGRLASSPDEPYRELCRAGRRADVRFVLYVGRGTSDNAAVYGQYLASVMAGLPSGLALPSAATLYSANLELRHCLVVGISQSGATPDVAEMVDYSRRHGALTLAITNEARSPLAGAASYTMETGAGRERAVAATKTYTAQLLVLARLWATWTGRRSLLGSLVSEVPSAMQRALDAERLLAEIGRDLASAAKLFVVARGYNLATALETSLKLQETSGLPALAYSGSDLMHGPIAVLDPLTPTICFLVRGRARSSMLKVVRALRERGARLLLVGDGAAATGPRASGARVSIDSVPEALSPLVAVLPGQLLAYHLALARGRDPDHPSGLDKVTMTR